MVKTPNRPTVCCKLRKNGIFWDISFSKDYILEKENTHIPSQLLYFPFLTWDYIAEQVKVLDSVQLLDITTRVLFT